MGDEVVLEKENVGKVVESKKHPGLWGIQNKTDDIWQAELPNGKKLSIPKGKSVPLFSGTKIIMGNKSIVVDF